jgi:amidase
MPFGLQIIGPRGGDALVLGVAASLERLLAGDVRTARPVPDIGRLRAAPPIAAAEGFRDFS